MLTFMFILTLILTFIGIVLIYIYTIESIKLNSYLEILDEQINIIMFKNEELSKEWNMSITKKDSELI